jgi:hypothetical protein
VKSGDAQPEPVQFLTHDSLLHEHMAVHRLDHADRIRPLQPPQRAQSRSVVAQEQVRLARRRGRAPIEPELAGIGQFLAYAGRRMETERGEIKVLHVIRADQRHAGERRARAEAGEAADKRAQATGPRQRRRVAIMMRTVG